MKKFNLLILILLVALIADGTWQVANARTRKRKATTSTSQKSAPAPVVKPDSALTFTVNGVSFTMVFVEGGTFTMGAAASDKQACDWEKPAHKVTVSSFFIGQTEVTQELWQAVMGYNPSYFNGKGNSIYNSDHDYNYGTDMQRPLENASWDDCQEFIRKLNQLTGKNFRLPTEAEWEYAARGGNRSRGYTYSGSNNINEVAWYCCNSGDKRLSEWYNEKSVNDEAYVYRIIERMENNHCRTHRVASKKPNELALYDMSGNVWEWCQDNWYNYDGSYTEYGSFRVNRGGSCNSPARISRATLRGDDESGYRDYDIGLRLAL
ncbi:MAG: formylglycine-generating enzyme family protein [Muribaculaceae bacterium]|nr:formylglycine-generating enzyme family protein [Muribaculaceae bacterium]